VGFVGIAVLVVAGELVVDQRFDDFQIIAGREKLGMCFHFHLLQIMRNLRSGKSNAFIQRIDIEHHAFFLVVGGQFFIA